MRNKPVTWMKIETDDEGKFRVYSDTEPVWDDSYIPLYTHPVKELTDFEIMQISATYPDRLYFAKAILRKAQEK